MAEKPDGITLESISAVYRRQVVGLKRQVTELANKFGVVRESLKETAPKIMKLFNQIKVQHEAITFVEFARFFAPDLPTHAVDRDGVVGYRNHKVYYTLDYMRRMANLKPRGRRGVRDSSADGLARSLATILQVVDGDSADTIWKAVQTEFGYGERVMTGLKRRVENTKPLVSLTVPRAGQVRVGGVIHMAKATTEVEEAEPMAQGRRRVRLAS